MFDMAIGRWRTVAIIVVLLMLGAAAASAAVPNLQVCRQQLAQTGTAGVVTVCGPWLGDTAVLGLVALLAVLIILPALSKLDIGGLFSIETKADQAIKDAGEAKALAVQLQEHTQSLTKLQADLADVQEQVLARLLASPSNAEFNRQTSEPQVQVQARSEETASRRAALTVTLLGLWEQLRQINDRLTTGRNSEPTPQIWGRTLEWKRSYKLEINQVTAVRNQVAHGGEVSIVELERAVQLANHLLEAARATIPPFEPG